MYQVTHRVLMKRVPYQLCGENRIYTFFTGREIYNHITIGGSFHVKPDDRWGRRAFIYPHTNFGIPVGLIHYGVPENLFRAEFVCKAHKSVYR